MSGEELQVLRSMPNLESLTFSGNLPSSSLRYVSELPNLRYLRLPQAANNRSLPYLGRLSQLQTLDVEAVQDYGRFFDQVCQLSNLRTLVLTAQPSAKFKTSDWERLRTLPRLQRIFLRGTHPVVGVDSQEVLRVQVLLPHVKVRPANITRNLTWTWNVINCASTLICMVLVVQLSTQFSHAQSRLIPNYSRPHLLVAALLMMGTTIVHTVILMSTESTFLASLAASLIAPGLFWWVIVVSMCLSTDQSRFGKLNVALGIPLLPLVPALGSTLMEAFLSDVDWFLQGHHPAMAWGIVASSLISPLIIMRRLPRLHSYYAESGVEVMLRDIAAQTKRRWGIGFYQKPQAGDKLPRAVKSCRNRLDALLAKPLPRDMSRMWIAGNSSDGVAVAWASLRQMVVMTVIFYVMARWNDYEFEVHEMFFSTFGMMAMVGMDAVTLALTIYWRSRRPMLAGEFLRPLKRQAFVRQLFLAVGRDLWPMLLVHAVLITGLAVMWVPQGLLSTFIPAIFCYFLFRGLVVYAFILLSIPIRSEWRQLLLVALALAIVLFAGYQLFSGVTKPDSWYPAATLTLYLAGSVLAALGLVRLNRRWEELELA